LLRAVYTDACSMSGEPPKGLGLHSLGRIVLMGAFSLTRLDLLAFSQSDSATSVIS
jgi:hypothetical protein